MRAVTATLLLLPRIFIPLAVNVQVKFLLSHPSASYALYGLRISGQIIIGPRQN